MKSKKYIILVILLVSLILLAGCETQNKTKVQPPSSLEQFDKCDINKDGKIGPKEKQRCIQEPIKESTAKKEKCGDSICDDKEKKENICPEDCKEEKTKITCPNIMPPSPRLKDQCTEKGGTMTPVYDSNDCIRSYQCSIEIEDVEEVEETKSEEENTKEKNENPLSVQDSPFGILSPYEIDADTDYMNNLGAKWARRSALVLWGRMESNGWTEADNYVSKTYSNEVNLLFGIGSESESDREKCYDSNSRCINVKAECLPCDMEAYSDFVAEAINRYKDRVKYWQVGNEENHRWKGTPKEFAELVRETSIIIKQNCPECKVAIGGVSSTPGGYYEFYDDVLDELNGDGFDIFDFHWFGNYGEYNNLRDNRDNNIYNFKEYFNDIKSKLESTGSDAEIWITEMATYSGDPEESTKPAIINLPQTEEQQGIALIKRYIYPLAHGVKKIFWVKLTEWYGFSGNKNGYFDNTGLVNNPQNDGESHKKLSYYAYKKMIEVLDGSDWNNIQTIQESDDVYIYKFTKNHKPIWIVWVDDSGEKQVTISGISSNQVTVTDTVPKYETGKEVTDFNNAFNTETKTASNGQVTITLGDVPVFVEEE